MAQCPLNCIRFAISASPSTQEDRCFRFLFQSFWSRFGIFLGSIFDIWEVDFRLLGVNLGHCWCHLGSQSRPGHPQGPWWPPRWAPGPPQRAFLEPKVGQRSPQRVKRMPKRVPGRSKTMKKSTQKNDRKKVTRKHRKKNAPEAAQATLRSWKSWFSLRKTYKSDMRAFL